MQKEAEDIIRLIGGQVQDRERAIEYVVNYLRLVRASIIAAERIRERGANVVSDNTLLDRYAVDPKTA
jgi:hypothetical protein